MFINRRLDRETMIETLVDEGIVSASAAEAMSDYVVAMEFRLRTVHAEDLIPRLPLATTVADKRAVLAALGRKGKFLSDRGVERIYKFAVG